MPDEEGFFGWNIYGLDGEADDEPSAAVTKFAFDEEGEAQVSFYADSWGYTYFYEDGVPYMLDTYGYTDEIEAYSAVFKDSYLSEAGDKILLDAAAGKLTFNGTETEYAAGYGAYGAGLSFTAGGKEYSLIYMLKGAYAFAEGESALYADYNPERIKGAWSNSSGAFTISVDADDKISFNESEYPLKAYAKDGEVLYDFTVNEVL